MPDEKWWRPSRPCLNFGPDHENGRLAEGARFTCHDLGTGWPVEYWQWDMAGRYAGPAGYPIDDMPKARYERSGSQLLFASQ